MLRSFRMIAMAISLELTQTTIYAPSSRLATIPEYPLPVKVNVQSASCGRIRMGTIPSRRKE